MVCGHWCIASKVSAVNGVGVFVWHHFGNIYGKRHVRNPCLLFYSLVSLSEQRSCLSLLILLIQDLARAGIMCSDAEAYPEFIRNQRFIFPLSVRYAWPIPHFPCLSQIHFSITTIIITSVSFHRISKPKIFTYFICHCMLHVLPNSSFLLFWGHRMSSYGWQGIMALKATIFPPLFPFPSAHLAYVKHQ